MQIEEITLKVPHEQDRLLTVQPEPDARGDDNRDCVELTVVVRDYLTAVHARDGFAFTERTRARRRERFQLAFKSLAKGLSVEATRTESDRVVRGALRARVYTTVAALLDTVSRDQLRLLKRSRRRLRWSIAFATFGLAALAAALVYANGAAALRGL